MAVVTPLKTGPGRLAIGSAESGSTLAEVSTRVTSIRLVPDVTEEDDIPVLSGDTVAGDNETKFKLAVALFSDFGMTEDSFVERCYAERGRVVDFEFIPSSEHGRGVAGQLKLRPIEIGGEVGKHARPEVEFSVIGDPELITAGA